jgi:hypothetical protein
LVELRTTSEGRIVFDAAEVRAAMPKILERYHITRDRSADLPGPGSADQGGTLMTA